MFDDNLDHFGCDIIGRGGTLQFNHLLGCKGLRLGGRNRFWLRGRETFFQYKGRPWVSLNSTDNHLIGVDKSHKFAFQYSHIHVATSYLRCPRSHPFTIHSIKRCSDAFEQAKSHLRTKTSTVSHNILDVHWASSRKAKIAQFRIGFFEIGNGWEFTLAKTAN